jgi:DNA phosphorothioation-dependent restriction protein DptG
MSPDPDYSSAAKEFRLVAEKFCQVVDAASALGRDELLLRVYELLPELIGKAINLPRVEISDDESQEEENRRATVNSTRRLSEKEWQDIYELLKEKLADWNVYWQVWDPTKEKEAIAGSLADDIADIYRDLMAGISIGNTDKALPKDSIWEWRFGFCYHWGKHATDALRTLHALLEEQFE